MSSFLKSLTYHVSYYLFYSWHTLLDYYYYLKQKIGLSSIHSFKEKINMSHIYFRPTSNYRKDSSYDKKIFLPVSHDHNYDWKSLIKETEYKNPVQGDTLEIHYTVTLKHPNGTYIPKSYIVPYTYPHQVIFPPYSLSHIQNYYHSDHYKHGIISAEIGENDITNEVERWMGPLDNFYSDLSSKGIHVTKKLIVGSSQEPLLLTDNNVVEHKFEHNDKINLQS